MFDSLFCFFFQAEDGIRDLVRSRGLGDVYKRQGFAGPIARRLQRDVAAGEAAVGTGKQLAAGLERDRARFQRCLLYTSDAADERSSVDLGGRRIIKKKNNRRIGARHAVTKTTTSDKTGRHSISHTDDNNPATHTSTKHT